MRAFGITTAQRAPMAPEIPPLAEVGLPGYDAASWHMIVAPAATPKPILARLNTELTSIVKDEAVGREFIRRGFVPSVRGAPDALAAFVKSEIARWGEVVRRAGAAGIE